MTASRALGRALALVACLGFVLSLSACPALASSVQSRTAAAPQTRKPRPPTSPTPPTRRPVAPVPPSAAETAAIGAVVQAYFTALNARDVTAALRLWSERESAELATVRQALPRVLERMNPTWSDVEATVLSVEGDTARARVIFKVSYQSADRPEGATASLTRNVMVFVREAGEWRITADRSESRDIAEQVMRAPDEEALTRIVADNGERLTLAVVRELLGLAGYAAAQEQFDAAIAGYTRAIRLAETPVAPLSDTERQYHMADMHLATALVGLAQVHTHKTPPDLPRAIELLTRALALHERTSNDSGVIETLQGLGNAYYSVGDYAEALDRYQRVLPVAAKLQDRDATARTQLGIGNVQYLFGQYDLARAAYANALEIYTAACDQDAQPRALQGLGRVLAATGDFDGARAQFEAALRLLQRTIRKSDQAAVLIDIGRVAFQQGQFADARPRYDLARTLAESAGDGYNLGRAHYSLGLLHGVEGEFDRAIEQFTQAAEAFQSMAPPNVDSAGQAILARASAQLDRQDLPHALEDFTTSLQLFASAPDREGMARAHLGLAMTHGRRHLAKPALDAATRALDLAERAAAPDVRWQAHHQAGKAWLLAGDAAKARRSFEDAIRILEDTRFEGGAEAESQAPSQRAAPYVALVEWHVARVEQARADRARTEPGAQASGAARGIGAREIEARRAAASDSMGRLSGNGAAARRVSPGPAAPMTRDADALAAAETAEAFMAAEAEKRRLLEDLLRPFHFRLTRGLSSEQRAEEGRLINQRVSLLKQLRRERDLARPNATRVATLEQALATARASTAQWNQAVARDLPSVPYQRGAATLASLDSLAAALPANAALVHFVVGDERTSVIVATHAGSDGPRALDAPALDLYAFTVPVTRHQLAEQVWRFTDAIARRTDTATADARALYDLLLAPAADRLAGRSSLVIVPDDSLWTLPFEALMPADDRYLIQDLAITAIPSAATWVMRPAPSPAEVSTQALTAPDASGEFSDISPLQTRLAFHTTDLPPLRLDNVPAAPSPNNEAPAATDATTLAAWELFDRTLPADEVVLADVRPKPERLRLDAGRLGATGLFWALQAAGARRIILARRPLPTDAPVTTTLPLPHPYEWATWLVMGPPSQDAPVARLPE